MSDRLADHRLPRTVVPHHYQLELSPDLAAASFSGTATVDIEVIEETNEVVLNAAELDVLTATVRVDDRDLATSVRLDEQLERVHLSLPDALPVGPATLDIVFTGVLNDQLRGFYRSTFTDDDGHEQVIATTQFESTNARRAFPCWDEPDLKATFGVTLVIDPELFAVSSGPEVKRTSLDDGRLAVRFDRTMSMSTYLLAFVVGPLEATDPVDVDGVPLRIVHPRGKGHLTDFALDAGAFSLRHFTESFGIGYPGTKLDLVAVPDFAFGAMENQGCATFREILLLVDPSTTTQPEQQRAVDVIAHEIAHMWFGNLVTMKWWNGIWLKEAFATFCETQACDRFRPEWMRWVSFGLDRTAAFDVDALGSTRPIEFEVISPDDAEAMYDTLTYEKGGAVVRMLEQYLGEDVFAAGIHHYLSRHAFGNTETHQLWDAIEESSGAPVRAMMDSWIFQGGHPLITAERTGTTTVRLTQERFAHPATDLEGASPKWNVPLVLSAGTDAGVVRRPVLLDDTSLEVDLGVPYQWINANTDGNGFYRVRYVDDLLLAAIDNHGEMAPIERYGLVDDAWAAFEADRFDLDALLELVEALAVDETDLAVWQRIVGIVGAIDHHLPDDLRAAMAKRNIALLAHGLDLTGTEPRAGDDDRTNQLRATLLRACGNLGDASTVELCRQLLINDTDPERTSAAISVAAANGDADDFARFVDAFQHAATPQMERRYLFALADFPGAGELDQLVGLVDAEAIRSQDAPYVLARTLSSRTNGAAAWAAIKQRWTELNDRYPHNAITRMLGGLRGLDPALTDEVIAFFAEHEVPQAGKTLDQILERMRMNREVRPRLVAQAAAIL